MLLSACSEKHHKQQEEEIIPDISPSGIFIIESGEQVNCHGQLSECGANLTKCDNGKEYYCMHNVIELKSEER